MSEVDAQATTTAIGAWYIKGWRHAASGKNAKLKWDRRSASGWRAYMLGYHAGLIALRLAEISAQCNAAREAASP